LDVRERAVRALGEFARGDTELRKLYSSLDAAVLRERALRVFAEIGGKTNSDFVERVALDAREDLEVRDRAVRLLGDELGNSDAIRALYARLDHVELRARAVRSIAEHLNSESAAWVRGIAENQKEDQDIRDRAIRTLAEAGYVHQVRALYERLNDEELQERVIRVVAEHGSVDDQRWIERLATNTTESDQLRERALRVLAERGMTSPRLAALYDQIDNNQLRERLLKLMGERADDASIEKLIAVARGTGDIDLRRRAAKLLAESEHPRAREFLRTTAMER
jgi:SOS response regulatory protein OraA/RecX